MLRRFVIPLSVLAVFGVLGGVALAVAPPHRAAGLFHGPAFWGGAGPERFHALIADVLGLDESQQTQIESIASTAKQAIEPQRLALQAARDEIRDAIRSGAPESEVRALAEAQAAPIAVILGEVAVGLSRAYAVLTPEQQQRAIEIHDRFEKRRQSQQ